MQENCAPVPRFLPLLLLLLFACRPPCSAQPGLQPVFTASFPDKAALGAWDNRLPPRQARIRCEAGGCRLQVRGRRRTAPALVKALPIAAVAGRKLYVQCRLRHTGLRGARGSDGVVLALRLHTPSGDVLVRCPIGNDAASGWEDKGFAAVVPADASGVELLLGLQHGRGRLDVDRIAVRVLTPPSASLQSTPADAGMRLRGTMIAPLATAQDLRALAALGANHVRWQLTWGGFPQSPADTASLPAYRTWLRGLTAHIRSLLPLCDSLGLRVLLDMHTLPGGSRYEAGTLAEHRLFASRAVQAEYLALWRELATAFRDAPALWGYDLANEPVEGALPDSALDWQALAQAAAEAIRGIDTAHAIVVEGAPSGGVPAFPGLLPLTGIPNVRYSFHIYDPILFTHQGVVTPDTTTRYPGVIGGRYWDRDTLRAWMQPVRDWQLRHGLPVYVGEFSAVRWAPDSSAYRYIRDCIALFEEWGWSWAYHAFREWDGWSPEHGPDRTNHTPSATPTDRLLLLQEVFRRNGH